MTVLLSYQFELILYAFLLGLLLGVWFEAIRLWRMLCRGKIVTFLQDFLFCFVSIGAVTLQALHRNDGQLRWYVVLSVLTGFAIYRHLIGDRLLRPTLRLLRFAARIGNRALGICLLPFRLLGRCFAFLFVRPMLTFAKKIKNPFIFLKKYIIIKPTAKSAAERTIEHESQISQFNH